MRGEEALTALDERRKREAGALAEIELPERIESREQETQVAEVLDRVVAGRKEVEKWAEPMRASAYKTYKEILNAVKSLLAVPGQIEETCRFLLKDWGTQQAEAERLEQQRIQKELEEAKKRAEAEEAEQMMDRLSGEAPEPEAQRELQRKAQELESSLSSSIAKPAESVTYREDWEFRIVDETAIPREYLIVDEKKIRRVVKALRDEVKIPGVEAYPVRIPVRR